MKKTNKLLVINKIAIMTTIMLSTSAFAKDIIIDNNNSIFSNEVYNLLKY